MIDSSSHVRGSFDQYLISDFAVPLFRKLLLYPTELRGLNNLPHYHLYSFLTIHHQSQAPVIKANHRTTSKITPVPLGKLWDGWRVTTTG
jgi:hypothetical protein